MSGQNVIPCSDPAKQRHKIIGKVVALVGEESVSGVTAEPPPGQSGAPLGHFSVREGASPQHVAGLPRGAEISYDVVFGPFLR